jgi:outer membrane protein
MKKRTFILTFLTIFLSSSSLFPQNSLKIGHVNFTELIGAMPENDSAQVKLQKETEELNKVLEDLQATYNNLVDKYSRESATYSDAVKKTRGAEIIDQQKRINDFRTNANNQIERRNQELFNPIYNKINDAIAKIAKSKDLTYVLDLSKGSVVYVSKNSLDLNPLIINELGIKKK